MTTLKQEAETYVSTAGVKLLAMSASLELNTDPEFIIAYATALASVGNGIYLGLILKELEKLNDNDDRRIETDTDPGTGRPPGPEIFPKL